MSVKQKPTINELSAEVQRLRALLAERQSVDNALTESQRAMSTLISSLPGMVYRCRNDRMWTMGYVSEQALALTGYSPADFIDSARVSYAELIHPDDRGPVWEVIQEALKDRRPFQITYRITAADGREKWLWENGQGVFSPSGEVLAIEGYITDITRRTKAEYQNRLLALAIDQITEGVCLVDAHRRFLFANRACALSHGYSPEELLGKHISIFHLPEQMEAVQAATDEFERSGSFKGEVWHRHRDGSIFPMYMHAFHLRDEDGRSIGIITMMRDLTDQKRAAEERERLENQLYQIQKMEAIGQLAGGVAHDFNNLLAVILGNASVVQKNPTLSPKVREAMTDIVEAAERGSALTRQLLAYARGGVQKPVATDLNRLVRALVPILERTAPGGISFVLRLAEALPTVVADPPRIEQIVMNLCLNAIQASQPPAEIAIVTETVQLDGNKAGDLRLAPGRYLLLRVIDHGCGIDPKLHERVFEPFFSTREMGRGMGLAVAHGIVQSHRGQITLESDLGKGATFSVWLPASDERESALQPSPVVTSRERPPRGSETVLIIDDEPRVARTMEQMLSSLGYCTVSHHDADEALAFLDHNSEDVNLVLCDLNMPKHGGREIAATVAERYPGLAVILTSGADETTAGIDTSTDAMGYVQKPFTLMSLAKAVRAALDRHGPVE